MKCLCLFHIKNNLICSNSILHICSYYVIRTRGSNMPVSNPGEMISIHEIPVFRGRIELYSMRGNALHGYPLNELELPSTEMPTVFDPPALGTIFPSIKLLMEFSLSHIPRASPSFLVPNPRVLS